MKCLIHGLSEIIMTAMTQYEIESLWVKNALDVAFQPGNIVRVKSGQNLGVEGQVVALIALEPCPTYVLELPRVERGGDRARPRRRRP